jgi:lysophospholipase L1-like esterase
MKKRLVSLMILLGCLSLTAAPALQNRLQLPGKIYAVPGIECNIYFENIFLTVNPANFAFEVKCAKGRCDEKRWRFIPKDSEAGTYDLTLNVYDDNGVVATAASKLVVTPADAGKGKTISLLLIGDSGLEMTQAFPKHIHKLFQAPGNPAMKMVGENGPGWPDKIGEVRHEGYGGWSFNEFTTSGRKLIKGRSNARGNPFWNPETKALDFAAYFKKNNNGKAPDFILIHLGGNDVFACTDSTIDSRLESIREKAGILIQAIRKAAPEAVIAMVLVEGTSHSQDAFGKNYGCRQIRWQFKKNFFKYRAMMEEWIPSLGDPKVLTVPCHPALDTVNNVYRQKDYANDRNRISVIRESNGLHPLPVGYQQSADSCYAWMKALLDQTK